MASGPRPLELLTAAAKQFGASISDSSATHALIELPVRSADGREPKYQLRLTPVSDAVDVREVTPTLLPGFCPELHINDGGTFCLGLKGRDDLSVLDAGSADRWWGRLIAFLKAQARAKKARAWVAGETWPHGRAAEHQLAAERSAKGLGPDFVADLSAGQVSAQWSAQRFGSNARALRVTRRGSVAYTLWESPRRLTNRRQRCVCRDGSIARHRRLKSCCDHERAAFDLANAMLGLREAEAEFWEGYRGRACCGRLDKCPLRSGNYSG